MQDVRNQRTLTDTDVHGVLLNALHCAARTYDELRQHVEIEGMSHATITQLNEQFKQQAIDVRALADRIESALSVVLIGEGE